MKEKKSDDQKLSFADLHAKQKIFIKDLVSYRLSMDISTITSATNLQNLLRNLKQLKEQSQLKRRLVKQEVNT